MDPERYDDGSFDPTAPSAEQEVELPFPPGDERNAPYLEPPDAEEAVDQQQEPDPQPQQTQPSPDPYLVAQLQQERQARIAYEQQLQARDLQRAQEAWQAEQQQMANFVRNRDAALARGDLDPQEAIRQTEALANRQIQQRDATFAQVMQAQQAQRQQAHVQQQVGNQIAFERQALHEWTDAIAQQHQLTPQERNLLLGAHPDAMNAMAATIRVARQNHQTGQYQQRRNSRVDTVGGAGGRGGDPRLRPGSSQYDSDAHLESLLQGII